ncbi:hypothetical protein G6Z90_15875 [Vibrio aestuarianus subsp. cardii]|uniref:hypothetical protein n=1 Tax=Vibrio aestuarianus TaxID=28171 RepID=UPI001593F055|nr:hypothetical protein [Vibrio aestuarianus]MDE1312718.1 hypothetical protein [Vibrio aestuarianus]MDE1312733.1 hypothetical protein [Vibrio aestuarianus]NGZ93951.1 hypothetical protein [Vibrio aestuarianus subsp. cardii]
MIWGFLTVIVVGLILLFAAPFLDFLTPERTIWLVDASKSEHPVLLAQGSTTLWYQWQSWSYIFTFCLVTACVLGIIYNYIRTFSDETLIEAKQKWAKKTEELEQIKREYRTEVEQNVLREHSQEAERLKHRERELNTIQAQTATQQMESQERMKMASHAVRHQQKVTQSKLGQRDRLSNEKRLLAEYIEEMDWKFTDGSKVTYSALVKLAKENKKNG